jgi:hypothetical protein
MGTHLMQAIATFKLDAILARFTATKIMLEI